VNLGLSPDEQNRIDPDRRIRQLVDDATNADSEQESASQPTASHLEV
jgi:hypothetical protein